MERANATLAPHRVLTELINELLGEPFARDNSFVELDLDQVGKLLEEGREAIAEAEPSPELEAAKASHEKCVNLYCMILMELEQQRFAGLPDGTLYDLTHREEGTQVLPQVPPLQPSQAGPAEKAGDLPPAQKDERILVPPLPLDAGTFAKVVAEKAPQAPVEMPEVQADEADAHEEMVYEEVMTTKGSPHEREFRGLMEGFVGRGTRDHLELGLYFQLIKGGSFPFAPEHADRLSGQSFCFALESECLAKLQPIWKTFWPAREAAIRAIIDTNNRRYELLPPLKKMLDTLAKTHSQWLPEGKFPYAATLSSLRYISATLKVEAFQPSLLDNGILLLLFGQRKALEGMTLINHLGLEGLGPPDIVELTFRLARVQRFRQRIFNAHAEVGEGELETLQQDLARLFALLGFVESQTKLEKVA